jgi:hypothetical protein
MSAVAMSITDVEDEIDDAVNEYVQSFVFKGLDPSEVDIDCIVDNWMDMNREFVEQAVMDEIEDKINNFNEEMYNELEDQYGFEEVRDSFCFDPESIRPFLMEYVDNPFIYEHMTLSIDDFLNHIHTQWLVGDAQKEFYSLYIQQSWRL